MWYVCPVCGYPDLIDAPRSQKGGGSHEICPSCGFQFGWTDDCEGFTYVEWREQWQAMGMPWSSRGIPQPPDWNPARRLEAMLRDEARRRAL